MWLIVKTKEREKERGALNDEERGRKINKAINQYAEVDNKIVEWLCSFDWFIIFLVSN